MSRLRVESSARGQMMSLPTAAVFTTAILIVLCALLFVYQMTEIRNFAALGDRVELIAADGTVSYTALNRTGDFFFASDAAELWEREGIYVSRHHLNDYSRATRDLFQWNQLLLLVYLVCFFLAIVFITVGIIRGLRSVLREASSDYYLTDYVREHSRGAVIACSALLVLILLAWIAFGAIDGMRFELSAQATSAIQGFGLGAANTAHLIPASEYGWAYQTLKGKLHITTAVGALAGVAALVLTTTIVQRVVKKFLRWENRYV